jgi:hypothetical protein
MKKDDRADRSVLQSLHHTVKVEALGKFRKVGVCRNWKADIKEYLIIISLYRVRDIPYTLSQRTRP